MGASRRYELVPKDVPEVDTPYRRIVTKFPVPESIPLLESLRAFEPQSMEGQPPVVWDHGEGCQVFDKYGNTWLDFSSGVLVANAGHGRKEIAEAVIEQAERGLLTVVNEAELTGASLDRGLRQALAQTESRPPRSIDMAGDRKTAAVLQDMLARMAP